MIQSIQSGRSETVRLPARRAWGHIDGQSCKAHTGPTCTYTMASVWDRQIYNSNSDFDLCWFDTSNSVGLVITVE